MEKIIYDEIISIIDKIDEYSKEGYSIKYDFNDNVFRISYNNSLDYVAKLYNDNNSLLWFLEPYNNSHFTTAYDNGFEMVLFAIKENETIFK